MKISPPIVAGAVSIRTAITELKDAVKNTGLDSTATHDAEFNLIHEMAAERRRLSGIHASVPTTGQLVALNETGATLTKAEKELKSLGVAERKQRMAEFVPKGTEWPQVTFFGSSALDAAKELQKLADVSGKPQGYVFNQFPLVAMPKVPGEEVSDAGARAAAAVDGWMRFMNGAVITHAAETFGSLGFEVRTLEREVKVGLEVEELAKTPPRSLETLMAALAKANPQDPFSEGLKTLVHPGEMKLLVEAFLDRGPKPASPEDRQAVRSLSMRSFRIAVNDRDLALPGTKNAWNRVCDEVLPDRARLPHTA